jgi:hypothetical protein
MYCYRAPNWKLVWTFETVPSGAKTKLAILHRYYLVIESTSSRAVFGKLEPATALATLHGLRLRFRFGRVLFVIVAHKNLLALPAFHSGTTST